jgi:hypothetical protein
LSFSLCSVPLPSIRSGIQSLCHLLSLSFSVYLHFSQTWFVYN